MKKLALVTLLLVLTPSCASLFTGMSDEIRVTSEPAGAYFRSNLGHFGQTPARIDVPGDATLEIVYFSEGYLDQKQRLGTQLSGWIWGNVITGFLGAIIDFAGPGYTHPENFLHANLQPKPAAKLHPLAKAPLATPTPAPQAPKAPFTLEGATRTDLTGTKADTTSASEVLGVPRQHTPSIKKESFEEWLQRESRDQGK